MGIGDYLSQLVTRKSTDEKWDYKRTARMSFTGFTLMGPCLYFWHRSLEKYCHFSGNKGVLQKLALDQFFYAPTMLFSVLFLLGNLEQKPISHIKQTIEFGYFSILKTNYLFWPFVNYLNFRFVPYLYRTVFINCAGICWSLYLSDYRARHFHSDLAVDMTDDDDSPHLPKEIV